jgi:aminopeptidase YwaD
VGRKGSSALVGTLGLSDFEYELCRRLKAGRILSRVEDLVGFGDRFVGSAGDRTAAEYVRAQFGQLGFEVENREFTTLGYQHSAAEVRLIDGRVLEAIPPYFSPPTPTNGVRGELVFVGGGDAEDYEGLDVAGKIPVIQETGLGYARFWMGKFAAIAAQRGAVAVVVIHPLPWPYRMSMEAGNGRLEARFLQDQVPVVCISAVDGALLMHAIGSGQTEATIVVACERPEVSGWNVSGILRGSTWPEERILVVAHRDHGLWPGANDNGSGFGTMLEVACALAEEKPRRSVEFLCTTAEEGVTKGIAAYIEALRHEGTLSRIRAAIDLDMFGTGGKLKLVELGLWPDTEPIRHTEWLMQWIEHVAEELGYDIGRMTASWGVAESGRLIQAGVPAAWFWRPDDFYYHSIHDSVDKLDGNCLKAVGDITVVTVWQLANADELPRQA